MKANGSPPAIFKTDPECHYFLTILPIHSEATRRITREGETHPYTGVFDIETIPIEIKKSIESIKIRCSKKELRALIQKLCAWKPLTSQQLVDILKRKDKKHFVRSHLTPMIKEGTLKYLFPEDEDSPNQAYIFEKKDRS
jgi:ATP-dependent DNA helicase RecG